MQINAWNMRDKISACKLLLLIFIIIIYYYTFSFLAVAKDSIRYFYAVGILNKYEMSKTEAKKHLRYFDMDISYFSMLLDSYLRHGLIKYDHEDVDVIRFDECELDWIVCRGMYYTFVQL